MTGILLLAMGHKNYAELACNLAMSLRVGAPDVDITLAWHGYNPNQLSAQKQQLFNAFVEVPDDYLMKNGKRCYFRVKTLLNKLSPYNNTLFLDADIIWFDNDVTKLFYQFDNLDFTITNWGATLLDPTKPAGNVDVWANAEEVAEQYNLWGKNYVPTHSELIWFKKNEQVDELFTLVNQIYDNPKVAAVAFAGDISDELGFNIAMPLLDFYPHRMPWLPVWWNLRPADQPVAKADIPKKYLGMSMATNIQPQHIINRYNNILLYAAQKAGIVNYWKYVPKRRWAPNRQAN